MLIGRRCENIPSLSSRIPQDRSKVWALAREIGSVTRAEDPSEDGQEKASTMSWYGWQFPTAPTRRLHVP